MSALGQKETLAHVHTMSAIPPKADIRYRDQHVRFVPKADILRCSEERRYSITSAAVASRAYGHVRQSALAVPIRELDPSRML
jgi:hypothetical protein